MIYTTDSLTSLVSGMGNVQRDKLASTTYSYVELTDGQLTNAYRNSWVAKRLVDVPAMDAIKNFLSRLCGGELCQTFGGNHGIFLSRLCGGE